MSRAAEAFAAECDLPSKGVLDLLASLGIGLGVYEVFQLVTLAKIKVTGRTFQFHESGSSAFVTPIRCADAVEIEHPNPMDVILTGDIFDLIAWHPARPGKWALYADQAKALGTIEPQLCMPMPVRIHRCVLCWLRSGCSGLVLTGKSDAENQEILARIDTPIAETELHAAELRRIAALPRRTPNILVRGDRGRAA